MKPLKLKNMENKEILLENLEYNRKYILLNANAIMISCRNFIDWWKYFQTHYIKEKFDLIKQHQKRIFQIEKKLNNLIK